MALREATWRARCGLGRTLGNPEPRWASDVERAVIDALLLAAGRGVRVAGAIHLLAAVINDRGTRGQQMLAELELDGAAILRSGLETTSLAEDDDPPLNGAYVLASSRMLTARLDAAVRAITFPGRLQAKIMRAPPAVLEAVEKESVRQAARLGATVTQAGHLLLAVLSLDQQLRDRGWEFEVQYAERNRAAEALLRHGVSIERLVRMLVRRGATEGPSTRNGYWRRYRCYPRTGVDVAEAIDRTRRDTRRSDRRVGTSDLLVVLASASTEASILLDDLGIDRASLVNELRRHQR
jgi:hypothetical protein